VSRNACLKLAILLLASLFLLGAVPSLPEPTFTKIELKKFPKSYNPSLIRTEHGLLLSFRYHSDRSNKPWICHIGLVLLDESFKPISTPELLNIRAKNNKVPSQAEDARLFTFNDRLYVIYNDNDTITNPSDKQRRDMYIAEVSFINSHFVAQTPVKLVFKEKLNQDNWEKNWTPFVWNDSLYIVYSISPFEVIKPDLSTGQCVKVETAHFTTSWPLAQTRSLEGQEELWMPKIWAYERLRGGTPAVLVDGEYLSFFHSLITRPVEERHGLSVSYPNRLHYLMGAYTFSADAPFQVTALTPSPIIEKDFYTMINKEKKVIYPSGLVVDGSRFILSYGRDDSEIWIATYHKDYIKSLLTPVK
jgi:predicted GH43/DUF377 family glycosyl hydrolase